MATWAEPSHLRLQEPPQGPLLLDAFAAHVNGHAERQDDDNEQAPDDASCYQRCPAEEERNDINVAGTLGEIGDASETADPPTCCYAEFLFFYFIATKYDAANKNGGKFGITAAFFRLR